MCCLFAIKKIMSAVLSALLTNFLLKCKKKESNKAIKKCRLDMYELDVRKKFFPQRALRFLALLPREAVMPHPWRHSRPGWMGPWEA